MCSLLLALLVGQAAAVPPESAAPEPTFDRWMEIGRGLARDDRHADARDAFDHALGLARTLDERAEALAARAVEQLELGNQAAAQHDAYDAVASSRTSDSARRALVLASLKLRDLDAAAAHTAVLLDLRPDDGEAHALLAQIRLEQGRGEEAMVAVRQARALGVDRPWFSRAEALARRDAWIDRGFWTVAGMALFLAAGLLLFYGFGSLLSGREVGRLSAAQIPLLRGEQTPAERAEGRLYQAILWFGTALFYVSIPMMVLLSLASGWVLLYAMLRLPRLPLLLIAGALLIALGGAWAVIRGLFLPGSREEGGRHVNPEEEPRLFELLREVSAVATAGMVDRVHIEPGADIGVRETGSLWRLLAGRGERVLHLGFAALPGLTRSELKAILAHEHGHFSHGETRLTPFISRTTQSMASMARRMASLGAAVVVLSPVFWFLRLFLAIYVRVTAAHSRRRELLADRAAALAYGGDLFGRALERYVELSDTFERAGYAVLVALREVGRPCRDIYRCVLAAHEVVPPRLRALRAREGVHRVATELDSHPPPDERIARVAGLPGRQPPEPEPALGAFGDPPALARELTAELVAKVDAVLAARGKRRPAEIAAPEDGEASLAAALSLHAAALELHERRDPTSESVLREAVERLERAAGALDPVLVEPLLDLSRSHARRGERDEAGRTLERALEILEARGRGTDGRAGEIRAMLRSLEAT